MADPLFRNAYALLANTLGTAALGLLYWIVAARYYSPAEVGASSGLISALLLLSTVAQLNLGAALTRFLPRAGMRSRRFILASYAASASVAVVITLAASRWLMPMTRAAGLDGVTGLIWLAAAAVMWSIFSLQDHTLTGLRKAVWVPGENALFGALKIALLLALASVAPRAGIFASWTIPMALMLLPVNALIFGRFLKEHEAGKARTETLHPRQVTRFIAWDYAGSLFALTSSQLLPVLVALWLGPKTNGYFYVAWVVVVTLEFALISVTSSLTVEGAHNEDRLAELTRALGRRLMLAGLFFLAPIALAAPYLLSVFGEGYADRSSGLLRVLVLGIVPRGVIVLWMSVARVRNQVKQVVAVQALVSAGVLGMSAILIQPLGVLGIGVAYVLGQTLAAAVVLPRLLLLLRSSNPAEAASGRLPAPGGPGAVSGANHRSPGLLGDLTVIVPAKNAEAFISDCLYSVVRSGPAETILVDGLSEDSTVEQALALGARVITDGGRGLPAARALGASSASTRWVALIDADVVLPEGALAALLEEFLEGGYAGLQAGLHSVSGGGYWGSALANHHRFGFSKNWFGLACTIFEREKLLQYGFDPEFASGEDIELRLRLKDLNACTAVSRRTVVTHRFGETFAEARHQWADDGAGFARVIRKRGIRASWLATVPLASALWGCAVSLVRLRLRWLPYFGCYLLFNYASMFGRLFSGASARTPSRLLGRSDGRPAFRRP